MDPSDIEKRAQMDYKADTRRGSNSNQPTLLTQGPDRAHDHEGSAVYIMGIGSNSQAPQAPISRAQPVERLAPHVIDTTQNGPAHNESHRIFASGDLGDIANAVLEQPLTSTKQNHARTLHASPGQYEDGRLDPKFQKKINEYPARAAAAALKRKEKKAATAVTQEAVRVEKELRAKQRREAAKVEQEKRLAHWQSKELARQERARQDAYWLAQKEAQKQERENNKARENAQKEARKQERDKRRATKEATREAARREREKKMTIGWEYDSVNLEQKSPDYPATGDADLESPALLGSRGGRGRGGQSGLSLHQLPHQELQQVLSNYPTNSPYTSLPGHPNNDPYNANNDFGLPIDEYQHSSTSFDGPGSLDYQLRHARTFREYQILFRQQQLAQSTSLEHHSRQVTNGNGTGSNYSSSFYDNIEEDPYAYEGTFSYNPTDEQRGYIPPPRSRISAYEQLGYRPPTYESERARLALHSVPHSGDTAITTNVQRQAPPTRQLRDDLQHPNVRVTDSDQNSVGTELPKFGAVEKP